MSTPPMQTVSRTMCEVGDSIHEDSHFLLLLTFPIRLYVRRVDLGVLQTCNRDSQARAIVSKNRSYSFVHFFSFINKCFVDRLLALYVLPDLPGTDREGSGEREIWRRQQDCCTSNTDRYEGGENLAALELSNRLVTSIIRNLIGSEEGHTRTACEAHALQPL
jgi:hypothetical protein